MRRNLIIGGVLLGIVLVVVLMRRKKQGPPEQEVRARIDLAIKAVEERKQGPLNDLLSERFTGMGMDRGDAKRMLYLYMQRGAWRKVLISNLETREISKTQVEVTLDAVLAAGGKVNSLADVAPDSAAVFHFELTFELEDDDEWRVTAGTYKRARLRDLL